MNQMDFSKIMQKMIACYPDVNVSTDTTKMYYAQLKDLDYSVCAAAVTQLLQTSHFFPRIAQIREKAMEITSPVSAVSTIDAIKLLNENISLFGRYRSQEGMDWLKAQSETLYTIVKAIGYQNICNADLQRFRGEFESLYREADKSMKEQAMLSGEVQSKVAQLTGKLRSSALLLDSDDYY